MLEAKDGEKLWCCPWCGATRLEEENCFHGITGKRLRIPEFSVKGNYHKERRELLRARNPQSTPRKPLDNRERVIYPKHKKPYHTKGPF